jgi:hypothetical protein
MYDLVNNTFYENSGAGSFTFGESIPSPNYPQEIQNVTGLQNINVCGKNLFDENYENISSTLIYKPFYVGNGTFTLSTTTPLNTGNNANLFFLSGNVSTGASTSSNGVYINNSRQVQSVNGYVTIAYRNLQSVDPTDYNTQLEKGSTATTYEPYTGNTYEVNLGKNLISSVAKSGNRLFFNGGSDAGTGTVKAGTYTISYTSQNTIATYMKNTDGTQTNLGTGKTITFTSNKDFDLWLYRSGITVEEVSNVQLEKGSQATSYSPYFTPIELNKIGTYQDRIYKDNGKWYVEKQIGKVILDGTENWVKSGSTAVDRFLLDFTDAKGFSQGYANYFIVVTSIDTTVGNFIFNNATQIVINYSTYGTTTKDQFKTWLSTHNTQVNYILVTPTYTEITNTELINQLESIKSQDGTTNISITSENLPMIINASALKDEE